METPPIKLYNQDPAFILPKWKSCESGYFKGELAQDQFSILHSDYAEQYLRFAVDYFNGGSQCHSVERFQQCCHETDWPLHFPDPPQECILSAYLIEGKVNSGMMVRLDDDGNANEISLMYIGFAGGGTVCDARIKGAKCLLGKVADVEKISFAVCVLEY
jgi:hypothetical protein